MAYSTPAQVRAICDTDITDAELLELIQETDAFMDLKLNTGSINATVLRGISRRWTAITCFLKDPDAMSLGELRYDRGAALKKLNKELDDLMKLAGGGIAMQYHSESLPRW